MREESAASSLTLALTGRFAHPEPGEVLSGLTAASAGTKPGGASRTIHELLGHLVYWQDLTLRWLEGEEPEVPDDPEAPWPAGPRPDSPEAWDDLVERFADGLSAARAAAAAGNLDDPVVGVPDGTRLGVLSVLASHNSWHLGQMLMVRRMLGLWPTP